MQNIVQLSWFAKRLHKQATSTINHVPSAGDGSQAVDLTLRADADLVKHGTISSDGGLSLSAGAGITNTGAVAAAGSVSLDAPQISNSGKLKDWSTG